MTAQQQPAHERRRGEPAIPQDVDTLLTMEQRMALRQIESFGWELAFVRHPLFQETTVIVTRRLDESYAILTRNGDLDVNSDLVIRH